MEELDINRATYQLEKEKILLNATVKEGIAFAISLRNMIGWNVFVQKIVS